MYRVTKRFEFDAAHRLLDYEGPCANIHGHRYVVDITMAARQLDIMGMVIDFRILRRISEEVVSAWDHKLLLNSRDPITAELADKRLVVRCINQKEGGGVEGANPTAEWMARTVFALVEDALRGIVPRVTRDLRVVQVRVYETPTSWADYEEDWTL